MSSVVLMALSLCLGVVLPGFVVDWDVRRSGHLYVGRAWNSASLWSSVMAFGPLAVPVHFVRTRRSVKGFVLGVGCMLAIVACSALAQALVERLMSPN